MIAAFALIVGVAIGACIEARHHRCPDPDSLARRLREMGSLARQWEAYGRHQHDRYDVAAKAAGRWARTAHRWHTTAEGHAEVLRALGRVVAEGGTVDPHHPSQRRDEAA